MDIQPELLIKLLKRKVLESHGIDPDKIEIDEILIRLVKLEDRLSQLENPPKKRTSKEVLSEITTTSKLNDTETKLFETLAKAKEVTLSKAELKRALDRKDIEHLVSDTNKKLDVVYKIEKGWFHIKDCRDIGKYGYYRIVHKFPKQKTETTKK